MGLLLDNEGGAAEDGDDEYDGWGAEMGEYDPEGDEG